MPYLLIQTNVAVAEAERAKILAEASRTVADMLGKPENYVMIALRAGESLLFAGSDTPAAYLELKSIGLPETESGHFSTVLCDFVSNALNIPVSRIYIEFNAAPRHLWGWNKTTF